MLEFSAVTLLLLVQCGTLSKSNLHPLSDEFIDLINSKQTLWRAGRNFHEQTPMSYIKRLAGTIIDKKYRLPVKRFNSEVTLKLPKRFDARRKWPDCPTIRDIRDQGSCASCWAVASASAMTDRVCINSNAKKHFYFSDDDLLSCCKPCEGEMGEGCDGGKLDQAWLYYNSSGVVSGGSYDSKQGCKPYEIPPCEHSVPGNREKCGAYVHTPKCSTSCNKNYKIKYDADKHKAASVYSLEKNNVQEIKWEIYKHGPVSTSFILYEDFLNYRHGIYKHVEGKSLNYHSVKLIGWGKNDGVKYWVAANSWNIDWGSNGYFKIISGSNHCGIEEYVIAGKPQDPNI